MSDPFVAILRDVCRRHVTRAKWVFTPTHAIGRVLNERLALEGTNTLNLRFVSPLDVALRMGAPFLVERGIDPSEEGLGPALVMRLLLDLPEDGGYFRGLADQPPMAEALWVTIRELRMCGIRAAHVCEDAFASAAKHRELQSLLAAYERFLETNRRGDVATVYEEAVKHPDWCPIQAQDCWTALPDVVWSPLQRQLIDAMPGERIDARGTEVEGITRPRRLVPGEARPESRPSGEGRTKAPLLRAERISLFHAGGREAEIEEVFRRILASGLSLDEVEIACASSEHSSLAWEKALRHEWPVTTGPGLPVTFTRPGRALLALCEWIESDFNASTFRQLLQSGDVRLDVDDLTAGQAARLLVKAEASWGRETYHRSLSYLAQSYRASAANKDLADDVRDASSAKAARTEALRDWIASLLSRIPVEDQQRSVGLQDCVDGAIAFLRSCAAKASALDAAAGTRLIDEVSELRALGSFRCRLTIALRFIRERVEGLVVAGDRPRAGHLHISTLAQCAYAGRRLLFVVGLEEGRVFPTAAEDPVLLDGERARIHDALRLSKDRVDEAVYAVLSRLAVHAGPIVLSYSSRDVREYREIYASWLMLQAFRAKERDQTKSYADLHKALGEAKSVVPVEPDEAATDAGWWLANLKQAGASIVKDVLRVFPHIAQGRNAQAHRESTAFTEFDGYVPEAGKALDPCRPSASVSATALEEAATCGFKHFLKRGLRLEVVDDGERDGDVWLEPLVRGAELHDLYAQTLRRCRDDGRRPDRKRDRKWLLNAARERLEDLRADMPPPSDEVYERETSEFLADLELFLDAECDGTTDRTAVGLEVAFGRSYDADDEVEPLAQPEPVELDLGGGLKFKLAGQIDRIDRVGPSSFEIVDYKSGTYWAPKWASGVFAGGTRLQHALYGLAAVQLLRRHYKKSTVSAGVYYFPSFKGGRERRRIPTPSTASVASVLSDLRRMIVSGGFAHTTNKDDCTYCDFQRACGGLDAVRRAAAKRADDKLRARARLSTHE
jgi:hypothetical protein